MKDLVRGIFDKKNKHIRKKILFTLFVSVIFLVGNQIQVPNTTPITSTESGIVDLLDFMTGGGLSQFSIFALGVMPYITASIVIQLLSMDVIPYLTELKELGEVGRRKQNQITRYLGLTLAIVQGFAFAIMFDNQYSIVVDANPLTYTWIALILTAGTASLLWLGDQITARGIGNGLSVIIMIGIISRIPNMFIDAFEAIFINGTTQEIFITGLQFTGFVFGYLLIVIFVIFFQEAVRRIALQYSNRTSSAYGGVGRNFIPIKVNSAGVIPVIFASSIMTAPTIIIALLSNWYDVTAASLWIEKYLSFTEPIGFAIYLTLIFAFAYFYTFLQINPKDTAENLQKSGAYIPGVRPGVETEKYVSRVLGRLTFVGGLFIVFVAGLPIAASFIFKGLPPSVTIGGTGILIVVGVALEMMRQLEEQLIGQDYERYIK